MSDVNVRLNEKTGRTPLNDVGAFLTVIANAIMSGIANGTIRYQEEQKPCDKCGRPVAEYTLTILTTITIFFVLKLTVQIKALYDPACGLSYFRVKLVK